MLHFRVRNQLNFLKYHFWYREEKWKAIDIQVWLSVHNKKFTILNPQWNSMKTNKIVNIPSSTELKLNDYYDYCSKMFSSKTQEQQSNNYLLASQLNFDSVLILKSFVLQDLFSSAFMRYLEWSKQKLTQNLTNQLNEPIQNNNNLLQTDVLGRHSYPKRNNTDIMSSETIETDLQNCLGNHNKRRSPTIINKTMPLSSFYLHILRSDEILSYQRLQKLIALRMSIEKSKTSNFN